MANKIKGGKANDILNGTNEEDKIEGKDGDDQLFGLGADDELKGGKGNDLLEGGDGNDSLSGEADNDRLRGGAGMDVLSGDDGDDILEGEGDDDLLDGGKGNDALDSGLGNDILAGDRGDDTLLGGAGDDILLGDGKIKGNGKKWGEPAGSGSGKGSNAEFWEAWASAGSAGSAAKAGTGSKGTGSKGSGESSNDYLDGGAGSDSLYGWVGDDIGHYNVAENAGASDEYAGNWGVDTLQLELSLAEWLDPAFQGDLAAYLQFLDDHTDSNTGEADDQAFGFSAFDLTASGWEILETTVDGVATNPEDEAVTAKDDQFSTDEDTVLSGNVLADNGAGEDDIPDYLRAVSLVSAPLGALTLNPDGSFSYDPSGAFQHLAVGATAIDSFTYEVEDADGDTSTATVNITVNGNNDAPVAAPDSGETDADTPVTLDVLVNDADVDVGDVLSITSASSATGGSVQIVGNRLLFDPTGDFTHLIKGELEDVTLSYEISDGNGGTDTSTVVVTVEGTNTPPDAIDDSVTIAENTGTTINVLNNDIDPDPGEILTITNVAIVDGLGSVSTNGSTVSWEPNSFEEPIDPNADPGSVAYQGLVTDYDYLAFGETAVVTLEYTIEDRFQVADSAQVEITIEGVNDAPIAYADAGITEENTVLLVNVLGSDRDIDVNDTHTLDVVNITSGGGIASIDFDFLSWDPAGDYDYLTVGESAEVQIDYTMSDNNGAASSSTVTITVEGSNDAPIAISDSATTSENSSVTLNVLANDLDADANDTKILTSVSSVLGSASRVGNQLLWNPGNDFETLAVGQTATADVAYTVADKHGATSIGKATITVTGTNDLPVSPADSGNTVENAGPLTLDVLANDTDIDSGDTLSLDAVNFSAGAASIEGNKLVWDQGNAFDYLAAGESTKVSGAYSASDNNGGSVDGIVEITIEGRNDAPQAAPDFGGTDADSAVLIDVLANDSDVDSSDTLTIVSASSNSLGIVNIVGGQLEFDPAGQFGYLTRGEEEEVSLVYAISDGNGGADTNSVTVNVIGTNSDPVAVDDSAQVNEDVNTASFSVLDNDSDPDAGEVLMVTGVNILSGKGSATTDGKNVSWTSGGAYNSLAASETATVTLQYTIADSFNVPASALLELTVVGANDAPVLTTASSGASITEIDSVTGDSGYEHEAVGSVAFQDVDLSDAHTLTVTPGSSSGYSGALTASISNDSTGDGSGQISWSYKVIDSDLDSLKIGQILEQNYTITLDDGNGGSTSHAVAITINGAHDDGDYVPGNTPPVAVDNNLFTVNYDVSGYSYNSGNGHYYKFVPNALDWYEAKAAADAAGGYLVTVTTAQENSFVEGIASGKIWMAGSDSGTEGDWRWEAGPEAGDRFWLGNTTGTGGFENWRATERTETERYAYSEPNGNSNEHYAEMIGSWNGAWNDRVNAGTGDSGYVLEIDHALYDWYWTDKTTSVIPADTTWEFDTRLYTPTGWTRNPDNGHYYKYVDTNVSFNDALGAGSGHVVSSIRPGAGTVGAVPVVNVPLNSPNTFGVTPHLVTITSESENDFVYGLIGNSGRTWLAASDAASEGVWRWVAGPENGTQFWSGSTGGSRVSGRYENWRASEREVTITDRSEPNNEFGNENHLQMLADGQWNDVPYTTGNINYVIEVGGRPGDPDQPALNVPNEDDVVTIPGGDLLGNDFDVDGDPLVISSISPQSAGGATLTLTGGNVVFDPGNAFQHLAAGETTTDTFNYTIYDGRGSYDTAQATVTIRGLNDDPVANNDSGATKQNTALFLNVLANDTDIDGDTLSIVDGTTLSAQGAQVLANANGDVRYSARSASLTALGQGEVLVDTFSYTALDGFGGSDSAIGTVKVTGINDRPIAVTDSFSGNEDTVITGNVFLNDYDPDNGDSASMVTIGNLTSVRGGSVTLDSSGNFSYAGVHNFSGKDSFNYTITDTFGLTSIGTANITVNGVADAPVASVSTSAGSGFNEVGLTVTAGLTDTTESGKFVFTGLPTGVSILNQQGQNVANSAVSFFGSSQTQSFTVVLPEGEKSDFNIGVTATSTEQDTGSNASVASNTEQIAVTYASDRQTVNFSATDQNMWATGDALIFRDVTTIEIIDIHEGGTIFDTSISIPLVGRFDVDFDYSLDVDADLVSTLELNGGSVDADASYVFDLATTYNSVADLLRVDTSSFAALNGGRHIGSLDTFGPGGSYSLDLVFDVDASLDLDIDRKVWVDEWSWSDTFIPYPYISGGHWSYDRLVDWHPRISIDETLNLFTFDDTDISGSIPLGPLSPFLDLEVSWPSLDTSASSGSNGLFSSSGTSADLIKLSLDVDQTVAYAVNAALGNTTPSSTINPFDLTFGGDFGPISANAGVELLDFKVFGAANFVQDFDLKFDGFTTTLRLEDGTTLNYVLGEVIDISNASNYDANNDGTIGVNLLITPNVELTNDTDLGFDLGYELGLLRPVFDVSIGPVTVVDLTPDFLFSYDDRVQIATIDIFEDTFDFVVETELVGVPVDTQGYIV